MAKNSKTAIEMKKMSVLAASLAVLSAAGCGPETPDFDACGQVDAVEVTVSAENSGRMVWLDVSEGDRLSAGQCVGCIDTVQIWLQREELLSRRAAAAVKRVDVECQTAPQHAQLENLERELQRASALLAREAGTQKQVDDLSSQIAILRSQIAAAEQNYRQNNESIASEIATIDVQIAEADDNLRRCRVHSPIDGTVLTKYVEAGETVSSGKPLFVVADMDELYVRTYFSTAQLADLKVGDRVKVLPDDGSKQLKGYGGTVTWISDEAEFTPKNIQTRDERADLVYAVKVAVDKGSPLRLGMYAYVIAD